MREGETDKSENQEGSGITEISAVVNLASEKAFNEILAASAPPRIADAPDLATHANQLSIETKELTESNASIRAAVEAKPSNHKDNVRLHSASEPGASNGATQRTDATAGERHSDQSLSLAAHGASLSGLISNIQESQRLLSAGPSGNAAGERDNGERTYDKKSFFKNEDRQHSKTTSRMSDSEHSRALSNQAEEKQEQTSTKNNITVNKTGSMLAQLTASIGDAAETITTQVVQEHKEVGSGIQKGVYSKGANSDQLARVANVSSDSNDKTQSSFISTGSNGAAAAALHEHLTKVTKTIEDRKDSINASSPDNGFFARSIKNIEESREGNSPRNAVEQKFAGYTFSDASRIVRNTDEPRDAGSSSRILDSVKIIQQSAEQTVKFSSRALDQTSSVTPNLNSHGDKERAVSVVDEMVRLTSTNNEGKEQTTGHSFNNTDVFRTPIQTADVQIAKESLSKYSDIAQSKSSENTLSRLSEVLSSPKANDVNSRVSDPTAVLINGAKGVDNVSSRLGEIVPSRVGESGSLSKVAESIAGSKANEIVFSLKNGEVIMPLRTADSSLTGKVGDVQVAMKVGDVQLGTKVGDVQLGTKVGDVQLGTKVSDVPAATKVGDPSVRAVDGAGAGKLIDGQIVKSADPLAGSLNATMRTPLQPGDLGPSSASGNDADKRILPLGDPKGKEIPNGESGKSPTRQPANPGSVGEVPISVPGTRKPDKTELKDEETALAPKKQTSNPLLGGPNGNQNTNNHSNGQGNSSSQADPTATASVQPINLPDLQITGISNIATEGDQEKALALAMARRYAMSVRRQFGKHDRATNRTYQAKRTSLTAANLIEKDLRGDQNDSRKGVLRQQATCLDYLARRYPDLFLKKKLELKA